MNVSLFLARSVLAVVLLGSAHAGIAAPPAPEPGSDSEAAALPDWEQLTPAQREAVITTVRDRWNDSPDNRARMLQHAQRWQRMSPEQRSNAMRGVKKWQGMDPQQREQARAAFQRMRALPPEQRRALRQQLKAMTPEQRKAWAREQQGERRP